MPSCLPSSPNRRAEAARILLQRRQARDHLLEFSKLVMPEYEAGRHHVILCNALDRFARGECRRLMVFMPPRHGKSQLVSKHLPAYLLGRNPDCSVIACSYGADLASRMNRDVQRIMDGLEYSHLFPESSLNGKNARASQLSYIRNSDLFEIVGRKGSYRSAGVGGGITGLGV